MKQEDLEKFDVICESIANSSIGLHHICKENNLSPTTFYKWINSDADLMDKYVRAREAQADYLADEIISIADDKTGDTLNGEFGETGNAANVSRSKLQVEARKWTAAKLKPKKYGDKVDVTSGGEKINAILPPFMKANES